MVAMSIPALRRAARRVADHDPAHPDGLGPEGGLELSGDVAQADGWGRCRQPSRVKVKETKVSRGAVAYLLLFGKPEAFAPCQKRQN